MFLRDWVPESGRLTTRIFRKSTATNSLLAWDSWHPMPLKRGIPKGQYLRARRNCSDIPEYLAAAADLKDRFQDRGYPRSILRDAHQNALSQRRDNLLTPRIRDESSDCVRIIATYDAQHERIREILSTFWRLLQMDPDVGHLVVFFNANADLDSLRKVKSAERIFLLLHKGPPLSKYKSNDFLTLIGEPHSWLDTLQIWKQFQEQLTPQGISHRQKYVLKRKLDISSTTSKAQMCKEETVVDKAHIESYEQTTPDNVTHLEPPQLPVADTACPVSKPITFRVSCRCSAGYTKTMTAQVMFFFTILFNPVA
ncbi:hypothetical protein GDO81_008509 [Engystomops pustulosus]|uniref:Helix-turn-helix domain-containing protein n=1 Tax=Engystomops pustulosus TaxID=76066 RepID=A0AAV7CGZ5_ENGPU|nr:hypothetical protein GDO81_008509 [Engystomops pustulosus]